MIITGGSSGIRQTIYTMWYGSTISRFHGAWFRDSPRSRSHGHTFQGPTLPGSNGPRIRGTKVQEGLLPNFASFGHGQVRRVVYERTHEHQDELDCAFGQIGPEEPDCRRQEFWTWRARESRRLASAPRCPRRSHDRSWTIRSMQHVRQNPEDHEHNHDNVDNVRRRYGLTWSIHRALLNAWEEYRERWAGNSSKGGTLESVLP